MLEAIENGTLVWVGRKKEEKAAAREATIVLTDTCCNE
jgi:hypothetical protein